mmetsp:Transcript_30370/g.66357  ORF Transcript_30370/g.66357 Transcript_30370/m.66357 type:complete len:501 (-) Transcript_30370:244-1746(-)
MLPRDLTLCFFTRCLRMFNYGAISPIFFLFCTRIGLSDMKTAQLITGILLGDLAITFVLTTHADTFGRRKTLVVGSILKSFAGIAFGTCSNFYVLLLAGILGVVSTTGGEIGPFMVVEQACITDVQAQDAGGDGAEGDVAVLYGWYNALGYFFQALGAVSSGVVVHLLQKGAYGVDTSETLAYRLVFLLYGVVGATMTLLYSCLSPLAEPKERAPTKDPSVDDPSPGSWFKSFGLRRRESRYIVARCAALFTLDAFAGGLCMQTWMAYWFFERWGFDSTRIGALLMLANMVAGGSGIAASYFVRRFGAMLTMIASHLPSNILLMLVPAMPTGFTASAMLVARHCISQMDVPARQAYVATSVASDERSAAGGITNVVRSLGMSAAPLLLGSLTTAPRGSLWFSSPWVIAGTIKIVYDISLYALYLLDRGMTSRVADEEVPDREMVELLQGEDEEADCWHSATDGSHTTHSDVEFLQDDKEFVDVFSTSYPPSRTSRDTPQA